MSQSQSQQEKTEEPSATSSEEPGRLTEKAGVVVGIVTGILGGLLAIGFALLPASTGAEKGFIIIASLALSIASVSGIGAWRSGRRFAFTAVLAGVAVICLATLSVAAGAGPAQAPQSAATSASDAPSTVQSAATTPTTPTPSSLSPTPSPGRSSPPDTPASTSQSLIDMTPVSGSDAVQSGPQSVNAHSHQQTLSDTWSDAVCDGALSRNFTYELNYKYRQFSVVVGLADTSPSGDTIQFTFLLNNDPIGPSPTLEVGQTKTITVSVAGAYRLTLQDSCTSTTSGTGSNVTAVWINPTVST